MEGEGTEHIQDDCVQKGGRVNGAVLPVSNVARVAYSVARIFDAGVLECRFTEAQAFAEQVAERQLPV